MAIIQKNIDFQNVVFNGIDLNKVYFNGILVFEKTKDSYLKSFRMSNNIETLTFKKEGK